MERWIKGRANFCFEFNVFNFQYVAGYWSVIRALRQSDQGDIADILENTICDSTGDLPRDRLSTYHGLLPPENEVVGR